MRRCRVKKKYFWYECEFNSWVPEWVKVGHVYIPDNYPGTSYTIIEVF